MEGMHHERCREVSWKLWRSKRWFDLNRGKLQSWGRGWGAAINKCGQELITRFNVSEFRNKDESKYHILPRQVGASFKKNRSFKNIPSTIVTLGIGKDTEAEKALLNVSSVSSFNMNGRRFWERRTRTSLGLIPSMKQTTNCILKLGNFFHSLSVPLLDILPHPFTSVSFICSSENICPRQCLC